MPTAEPPDLTTPKSLPDFQRIFPNEAACIDYLYAHRFPNGFDCPRCGVTGEPFRFSNRSGVVRCRTCRRDTSVTANTVIHRSKVPLSIWFWGAYLVTHGPPGMSALQFQKWLGMSRYETAFQMLHKLRAAMVRPNRDLIGSEYPVEVDETLVGGATQGEGKGVHHKTLVIGAVEVHPRQAIPFAGEDPNPIGGHACEEAKGAARKGIRRKAESKSAKGGMVGVSLRGDSGFRSSQTGSRKRWYRLFWRPCSPERLCVPTVGLGTIHSTQPGIPTTVSPFVATTQ